MVLLGKDTSLGLPLHPRQCLLVKLFRVRVDQGRGAFFSALIKRLVRLPALQSLEVQKAEIASQLHGIEPVQDRHDTRRLRRAPLRTWACASRQPRARRLGTRTRELFIGLDDRVERELT